MKFKVNKIAATVAMSLGTSVVGMNVAQAAEILFPNIGVSPTVTSILSVTNPLGTTTIPLHYRYYYKSATAAVGGAGATCQEANYTQKTSANDVVTFDVSGHFGDSKGVLFEPAPTAVVYNKSFAIFKGASATRAFAIVDDNTTSTIGAGLSGEAFLIEFTTGSVWGYQAYAPDRIYGWTGTGYVVGNSYDFSDRVETTGEVLTSPAPSTPAPATDNYVPIVIMPWGGNVQTALFVTPISTTAPSYQLSGTVATTIGLVVNDPTNFALDVMYDRDENPFSGALPQLVTCIGRVNIPSLISSATQQFVQNTGGWSNVAVLSPTDNGWGAIGTPNVTKAATIAGLSQTPTGQAVVLKLEYNDTAPAELDGTSTGSGSWNNGFWLKKGIRESVVRTVFPGQAATSPKFLPVYSIPALAGFGLTTLNSPYPLIDTTKATAAGLPFPPPVQSYGAGTSPLAYNAVAADSKAQ